jgi:DNA-binding MarR family transcriptional regulator
MTFPIPMNCELLDLRALVAVADGRNFMRAAQQLNLSQPALSRRIQKLEQAVGTVLVERTTRTVRLTAAGAQVVPLIRRMLQEIDGSLVGLMAQGERAAGRITLASIPSATVQFLPEVLQRFRSIIATRGCASSTFPPGNAPRRCVPARPNSACRCRSDQILIWSIRRSMTIPMGWCAARMIRLAPRPMSAGPIWWSVGW